MKAPEDLKERVQDISTRQTSNQAEGVGDSLVIQLEETAVGALNSVKARIQQVVAAIPEEADDARLEEANEELALGIRAAGQSVKGRAQAIREWHTSYKNEIDSLVGKALESTLETIDGIRELRLSEIGRRYADKDLAHKEWSRYNDLKKATQSWRDDVSKISTEDASIASAKAAGEDVENRGMSVAEETAKELRRLKDVAKWKVAAGDESEDFNTKFVPPVAARARQQVVEKVEDVKEAVVGSEQGGVESGTSVASEKVEGVASSAESASSMAKDAVGAGEQPAASSASEPASSVASAASETVIGSESGVSDSAAEAASTASSLAETISSSLSSMVADNAGDTKTPEAKKEAAGSSAGSAGSDASEGASSAAKEAMSSASSASSDAEATASSVADKASSTGKKVWGGANAQALVEAREPILDSDIVNEDASYSERLQSIFDGAMDQAAALTEAVVDAVKPVTSTQGTVKSATSLASEQYESAIAAASSILFGTEKAALSSGSGAAKKQYESAVTAYVSSSLLLILLLLTVITAPRTPSTARRAPMLRCPQPAPRRTRSRRQSAKLPTMSQRLPAPSTAPP